MSPGDSDPPHYSPQSRARHGGLLLGLLPFGTPVMPYRQVGPRRIEPRSTVDHTRISPMSGSRHERVVLGRQSTSSGNDCAIHPLVVVMLNHLIGSHSRQFEGEVDTVVVGRSNLHADGTVDGEVSHIASLQAVKHAPGRSVVDCALDATLAGRAIEGAEARQRRYVTRSRASAHEP